MVFLVHDVFGVVINHTAELVMESLDLLYIAHIVGDGFADHFFHTVHDIFIYNAVVG